MKRHFVVLSAFALAALVPPVSAQTSQAPAPSSESAPPPAAQNAAEIAFWNSIKDSKNPAELRAYLQAFPAGVFDTTTREAIGAWQKNAGMPVTGAVSPEQWTRLRNARLSTTWGAIAYTVRGAFGQTFNRASREEAEQEPLRECRRRAGRNADCRLLAGMDASCVAMSSYRTENRSRVYFGSSVVLRPLLADAISESLRQCNDQANSDRGCSARTTFCANGGRRR